MRKSVKLKAPWGVNEVPNQCKTKCTAALKKAGICRCLNLSINRAKKIPALKGQNKPARGVSPSHKPKHQPKKNDLDYNNRPKK